MSSVAKDTRAAINALSLGFGPEDGEEALYTILGKWEQEIGSVIEGPNRSDQVVSFVSELPLRVRGMGFVPVLWVGQDCANARQAITDIARGSASGRRIGVIVCMSDATFHRLRWSSTLPRGRCLLLSRQDLNQMLEHEDPLSQLRKCLLRQFPKGRLVPYSTAVPAVGSIFVGRQRELEMLIHENQDFTLCGPGGIGKTSLVRQMKHMMRWEGHPRHDRIVEVDLISCEGDLNHAAREIAWAISPTKFAHDITYHSLMSFFRRMRLKDLRFRDGPIDLVIDEVDAVLSVDRRTQVSSVKEPTFYPLMRTLMHARHLDLIRLIVIGRTETKTLICDPENPFVVQSQRGSQSPSRLKLMEVGPLADEDAKRLLLEPLRDLGYPVDSERDRLDSALAGCSGVPYDVQDLGLDLINGMLANQT